MGRKKYFAALAAAGMIGAMAVDQCSIHTPQMAGPSQMTTGPTFIRARHIQAGWKPARENIIWTFPMDI